MSKYLNADNNLDLSRVPRVLTLPLFVAVNSVESVDDLHLGSKTSDRFAASLAMEMKMSGRFNVRHDIFLLEPNGWRGYYFVVRKGDDGSEYVDLDEREEGSFEQVLWRQVKLDRWIRFPFMSIRFAIDDKNGSYDKVSRFYDDAQSCRYSVE
jgi:hypothetical protein